MATAWSRLGKHIKEHSKRAVVLVPLVQLALRHLLPVRSCTWPHGFSVHGRLLSSYLLGSPNRRSGRPSGDKRTRQTRARRYSARSVSPLRRVAVASQGRASRPKPCHPHQLRRPACSHLVASPVRLPLRPSQLPVSGQWWFLGICFEYLRWKHDALIDVCQAQGTSNRVDRQTAGQAAGGG